MRLFRRQPDQSAPSWSVVDIETTGLYPKTDRIVEIAVLTLDRHAAELSAWTTLVDPQRDVGASHIHGLRARDLRGAPRFTDVAHEVVARLSGTVLVAHNARFDASFLHAECMRAGITWGPIDGLCTMTVATQTGLTSSRSLPDCCSELGIPLAAHHTALVDARAVAGILAQLLPPRGYSVPRLAPPRPWPAYQVAVRLRTDPAPLRHISALGSLGSRVGVPGGLDVPADAATAYLALLDRVLEDRHLTEEEVAALADLALEWGISADAATRLHLGYLNAVWRLARADGVVTDAELHDVEIVAELLGVPLAPVDDAAAAAAAVMGRPASPPAAVVSATSTGGDLSGLTVCFTGESVCTVHGEPLSRSDQERLARQAGLIVKSSVSGRLDILVLADPDSQSGKARKATELGVRRIAEPVFWRLVGVSVD